jgi:hypothetical protein
MYLCLRTKFPDELVVGVLGYVPSSFNRNHTYTYVLTSLRKFYLHKEIKHLINDIN